jgi:hypothetical protein
VDSSAQKTRTKPDPKEVPHKKEASPLPKGEQKETSSNSAEAPSKLQSAEKEPSDNAQEAIKPQMRKPLTKFRKKASGSPSLSDLSSFEKEIHSHKQQAEAQKQELNLKNLRDFFKKLAETANPPSTRAVIRNTEVHLNNGQLQLQVDSDLAKSTLLKEAWIIEDVRAQFGKKLKLSIEVDPSRRQEPEEQKPISNKEIFDEMVKVNPVVGELRDAFALRFDKQ